MVFSWFRLYPTEADVVIPWPCTARFSWLVKRFWSCLAGDVRPLRSEGNIRQFFGGWFGQVGLEPCFLWVPKVTWKSFLACVLRGVCSHPAGVRVFRNRTCWCSGVSEPDLRIVFYGFQRWRERVFWHAFCLACPASVRVFRIRTTSGVSEPYQSTLFFIVFYGFQRWRERVFWHGRFGTGPKQCVFFMGSKGDVKEFFGMRLAWRVLVFGCFRTGPIRVFRNRTKALFFIVFYGVQRWRERVFWHFFGGWFLDSLGLNPAGVWLFRHRAERRPELPPKVPLQPAAPSTAPSTTWFLRGFFMLSKLPVWWCQALALAFFIFLVGVRRRR